MKIKTSITLSEDLLHSIDEIAGKQKNLSEFIEKATWDFIDKQAKRKRDMEDLKILNKKAERLNREAEDVLSYQADL